MDFSILVMTSKKYNQLVDGFLYFFYLNWKDCHFNIYVSLEEEKRSDYWNYKFITIEQSEWSSRLFHTLKLIREDRVYLLLDDYWLFGRVSNIHFQKLISIFVDNNYDYMAHTNKSEYQLIGSSEEIFPHWIVQKKLNYSYFVGSSEFYKKEMLLWILRSNETAWEFEHFASFRAVLDSRFKSARYFSEIHPLKFLYGGIIDKGNLRDGAENLISSYSYNFEWHSKGTIYPSRKSLIHKSFSRITRFTKMLVNIFFNKMSYDSLSCVDYE